MFYSKLAKSYKPKRSLNVELKYTIIECILDKLRSSISDVRGMKLTKSLKYKKREPFFKLVMSEQANTCEVLLRTLDELQGQNCIDFIDNL